jgi:hypothetical protein
MARAELRRIVELPWGRGLQRMSKSFAMLPACNFLSRCRSADLVRDVAEMRGPCLPSDLPNATGQPEFHGVSLQIEETVSKYHDMRLLSSRIRFADFPTTPGKTRGVAQLELMAFSSSLASFLNRTYYIASRRTNAITCLLQEIMSDRNIDDYGIDVAMPKVCGKIRQSILRIDPLSVPFAHAVDNKCMTQVVDARATAPIALSQTGTAYNFTEQCLRRNIAIRSSFVPE